MTPTVLVTGSAATGGRLADMLRDRGLAAVAVPTVELDTTSTVAKLDAMLRDLSGAEWLIVTSPAGAMAIAARGRPIPDGVRVAAVGPATAAALRDAGMRVDHVPGKYRTTAIAEGLGSVRGRRIVLARADAATRDLPDQLREGGARVTEVVAYRTGEAPSSSRERLRRELEAEPALLAFTSGSSVRGFLRLAPDPRLALRIPAACIGPVTASAARGAGFELATVSPISTSAGLADAIAAHLRPENA